MKCNLKNRYKKTYLSNNFWRKIKKELDTGRSINDLAKQHKIPASTLYRKVSYLLKNPNFDFSKEHRGKGKKKFTTEQENLICNIMDDVIKSNDGCAKANDLINSINDFISKNDDKFNISDVFDRNMLYRFVKNHHYYSTGKGISFLLNNSDCIYI